METRVKGRQYEVAEPLRRHVEEKLARLNRLFEAGATATVEIGHEPTRAAADRYTVQVTLHAGDATVRAEQRGADVHQALDAVLDVLQTRLIRHKERRMRRLVRRRPLPGGALTAYAPTEPLAPVDEAEAELAVLRVKRIPVKPISVEEAIEQIDLLGHDFYVFLNEATEGVCVLYRRHDGGFGLIQPEPA